MKSAPHPGEFIRKICIKPMGLTVQQAADGLGVSRKGLSQLLNGHVGISPEMAVRLDLACGGSAESWLTQQMQHDLAQAQKKVGKLKVKSFRRTKVAVG